VITVGGRQRHFELRMRLYDGDSPDGADPVSSHIVAAVAGPVSAV
jgi:hypothetical protein